MICSNDNGKTSCNLVLLAPYSIILSHKDNGTQLLIERGGLSPRAFPFDNPAFSTDVFLTSSFFPCDTEECAEILKCVRGLSVHSYDLIYIHCASNSHKSKF